MDGRLVCLLLTVTVGSLAQPYGQGHGQATSYANVLREHGEPTPYRVHKGFPSHESSPVTHLHNQNSYSLQQSYPFSYDLPQPYTYPVKYHLTAPNYESKGYQTYEAQSEEQDEADYSASAEHSY